MTLDETDPLLGCLQGFVPRSAAEARWLSVDDAISLTSEDNVKETIRRVSLLLG